MEMVTAGEVSLPADINRVQGGHRRPGLERALRAGDLQFDTSKIN
jgi:hypothetical protein